MGVHQSSTWIDDVKSRSREEGALLTVVERYVPALRRVGSSYRGPCPIHGGEGPNFSVRGSGFHCFVCGESGDSITLVQRMEGLSGPLGFVEAARIVAGVLGVETTGGSGGQPSRPAPAPRAPRPLTRVEALDQELAAREADGWAVHRPPAICAALLERLTLGDVGAAYLRDRGLDPLAAERVGLRCVPDAAAWDELARWLREMFDEVELERAGWRHSPDAERRGLLLPVGRDAALVIPYVRAGTLETVRFRRLKAEGKQARYRDLRNCAPSAPFNSDALDAEGGTVHLVEGELNALALAECGERAAGMPGAQSWRPGWAHLLSRADRVLVWLDADDGGDSGVHRISADIHATLGADRVRATVRHVRVTSDAADLHQQGLLRHVLARLA